MSGDWIKLEHTLHDKPEVIRMAEMLGIDEDAVVGKLSRLWIWADQQTVDGNAVPVTSSFLDRKAACPGFSDAMRKVAWLGGREGSLSFPRFDRHNGKPAKLRAETNRRVAKSRANKHAYIVEVTETCNADVTQTPLQKALPEKSREEIDNKEKNAGEVFENEPAFVAPKAFCINPGVTAIEVGGELLEYHEDPSRWQAEFVRLWNKLPKVNQRTQSGLDLPLQKALEHRLMDPGWRWKRAMACFPLPTDLEWTPNLTWFLKPDSVSKILDGSFQNVSKNAKRSNKAGLFGRGEGDSPTRVRTGETASTAAAAFAAAAARGGEARQTGAGPDLAAE